MPVTAGTQFGPYEIVAPLGAGGMGEVYRARDQRLQREVAIKILPSAMSGNEQALRRMEQEARAVAALNHPNLLSVYDIGQTPEGLPYIVSELLEGQSLRQRLAGGALEQRKAVDYGMQIARGLAAAHDKGIIHRDLKPENIFTTQDGRVKILDFGLAKLTAAASDDAVTVAAATTPGMVLGTVGYMSPEQVRGEAAHASDARSDIFSLGAVLYEMLAGKRAFRGASAVEVMSAILKEEPEPLVASTADSRRGGLTPALERIVRHCLEKEPRQRFQSADDVAFNLADLSSLSSSTLPAMPGARARRGSGIIIALSAALIAALGTIAWLAPRHPVGAQPQLLQATYRRGNIPSARFEPGGHNFVVSAAFNGATQDSLYSSATPTAADPATSLQPIGDVTGTVVSVSSQGAIAVLAQHGTDGLAGVPALLSVVRPGGDAARPLMRDVMGADFAPGGSGMAIARYSPASHETTLEYPVGHVLYRTSGFCNDLRFSPDGRNIAFLDHPLLGDTRGRVAIVDLQGHERALTPVYGGEGVAGLAWSPHGDEIWFSAQGGSSSEPYMYAVSLSGRVQSLWQTPSELLVQDTLPDGRALVLATNFRAMTRVAGAADPAGKDYTIRNSSFRLILSADGGQALIDDETGSDAGNYGTYWRTVGGKSGAVRLGDGSPEALSPDGKWALSFLPSTPPQLELLPTGPGEARPLTHTQLAYGDGEAAFLPDGQGILAVAAAPGRRSRTWLVGMNGSAKPVTPEGTAGYWPTPDGKYVLASDAQHHWSLYPLAGGAAVPEPAITAQDQPLRFGAGNGVLYVDQPAGNGSSSVAIYRLHLTTGRRELLFTARPPDPAGVVGLGVSSISRDGQTYSTTEVAEPSTLYVVGGLH